MIGDRQEIQPIAPGAQRQLPGGLNTVGCQRVGVQVALQQAQLLGREFQLVFDFHASAATLYAPTRMPHSPGSKGAGKVPGRGACFTDLNVGLVGTRCSHLGAVRGNQAQVDDIDLLREVKFP